MLIESFCIRSSLPLAFFIFLSWIDKHIHFSYESEDIWLGSFNTENRIFQDGFLENIDFSTSKYQFPIKSGVEYT